MKLTMNDINKKKQDAYDIYNRYQATMAGQLNDDVMTLYQNFDEIAIELGWESSDLWEVTDQHTILRFFLLEPFVHQKHLYQL